MDLSRCTNCGNCFQFCLFGVYEKDAQGQVTVARPDNCKPGCPACARICPSSAIMFPLYAQDPAVSGAPGCYVVVDEKAAAMFRERVQGRQAAAPEVFDEIDSLIDELKGLSDGGDA
jgi:NAD-dependent dihydropyrimidine dehydrogenase PreA subunit